MFYDPPVVDVLEVIARDLLLVGGAASVRVAERVRVVVRVQPAGCRAVCATQRHLRPERYFQRLSFRNGCQSTLMKTKCVPVFYPHSFMRPPILSKISRLFHYMQHF